MKKNKHSIFVFSVIFATILVISSCKQECKRSIYIWESNLNIQKQDNIFFKTNKIKKIYIRFFDIGWEQNYGAIPKAILTGKNKFNSDIELIPVLFIENSVFQKINENELNQLAEKINFKVNKILKEQLFRSQLTEIQLDCDWNNTTKEKYFKLIKELKKVNINVKLSATIRLHQIKYKDKTGIPPVDYGVLMYYNMGNFKKIGNRNSILDNEVGNQYINKTSDYPLKLTLALPIYSWVVWYKNNEFNSLIYEINSKNIKNISFLTLKKNNIFVVNTDTVYNYNYFRYGDIIKLENIETDELEKAKEICNNLTIKNIPEIILFSYSPKNTNLINEKDFNIIYSLP